jgi:hypothetical protein
LKKRAILLFLLSTATSFGSDNTRITITDYTVGTTQYVIHGKRDGKPITLLCTQDSPYCTPPKPGDYELIPWTVPSIEFRGGHACTDEDLYTIATKSEKSKKVGEYCLVTNEEPPAK